MIAPDKIKLIVFDWNGTLINDIPYHRRAYADVLKGMGIEADEEDLKKVIGRASTSEVIEHLERKYGIKVDFKTLKQEKTKRYFELVANKDLFFPHEIEMLSELSKRYMIAVFTGSSKKQVEHVMPEKIKSVIVALISDEDVERKKPDPEGLIMIMNKVDAKPHETLFVSDTARDMIAAKRAGVHGVGVLSGVDDREALEKEDAEMIFKDVVEFFGFLLKYH